MSNVAWRGRGCGKSGRQAGVRIVALALVLAVAPLGRAAAQGRVATPARWYSGDTHVHTQACAGAPDVPLSALYAEQTQTGLDVSCVLLWNNQNGSAQGVDDYYESYAPLVDGTEAATTQGDPDHLMHYGVEVSGFSASDFGHVAGIRLDDGAFPNVPYPAPILDFFDAQPGALTGYSHARWFTSYAPPQASLLPHPGSATAPTDLALGKIDFIELAALAPNDNVNFRGLYYKLLNAGLRVAITGGSDNTCISPATGLPRVYARIDSDPLTFTKWVEAVRAGRTTVAPDQYSFLELSVQGRGVGGQLVLAQPGTVDVVATFRVSPGVPRSGQIQIVQDGNVVGMQEYELPNGGIAIYPTELQVDRSGWIAARTQGLDHTGALYVIVEGQPICRALDAGYWVAITDALIANIGLFTTGELTQDVVAHLLAGRKVFAALEACDSPQPSGVQKYGVSSPACKGPIAIGVTGPAVAGSGSFLLTCVNAPPDALGVLYVSTSSGALGSVAFGVTNFVDFETLYANPLVAANGGGYAEYRLPLQPSLVGKTMYAQYVWGATPGCPAATGFSSSDAVAFTVQ